MKVNGIIAEYNPFHNGHRYQLLAARARTGAEYTIVAMSGNFVQRGGPALVSKHKRARMALAGGADLVLEIPFLCATASAEYFAAGGVALLDRLGVVTDLCFGSECDDIRLLGQIADILLREPEDYLATLKQFLKQGYSYPSARNWALFQHYPAFEAQRELLTSPNNILAIEYIKALIRRGSQLNPVAIRRKGAGYHDSNLDRRPEETYCSALAIRQALYSGSDWDFLQKNMPETAAAILCEELAKKTTIRSNDFSDILYYKLLAGQEEGYEKYLDVSPDLSDRIRNRLNEYSSYDSFCDLLKTKDMTHTRISRCLLHILLDIKKKDMEAAREMDYAPYARVLGFRKTATPLLNLIKACSSIPLISKLADAEKQLAPRTYALLKQDILVSQLYSGIAARQEKDIPVNEYTIPLVIL